MPWPVRLCVTREGNQGAVARAAIAAPTKEHVENSRILLRIFKEESELEVWKQDTGGHYQILKTYPICRWSGDLGPKLHEGDGQAPEGFYAVTVELMNPLSKYYLSINTGFPNEFDKANHRDGSFLMIHGDCLSIGCYAMTDEQIGEIYSLARDALLDGQESFQIQAYPFRMTSENLAKHRTNPNMAFWRMIKIGNDHFESTHLEPKVEVCNRRYVFDAQPPWHSSNTLVFDPTGKCPPFCESGNRWGGAGEATCRRCPVQEIGQRQCASRGDPQGNQGWRNEQSFPRPAWR